MVRRNSNTALNVVHHILSHAIQRQQQIDQLLILYQRCTDVRSAAWLNTQYLCTLSIDFVLCHPSGTYNFERVSSILESLCTPALCLISRKSAEFKILKHTHSTKTTNRPLLWQEYHSVPLLIHSIIISHFLFIITDSHIKPAFSK
jgi:hypothetical protein